MNNKLSVFDIVASIAKYVLIIVLIMFFMTHAKRFYEIGYGIFSQKAVDERGFGKVVGVEIAEGEGAVSIGEKLANEGLIRDASIFRYQERFSNYQGEEKPGYYTLSSDMTPDEMIAVMSGEAPPSDSSAYLNAAEIQSESSPEDGTEQEATDE